MRKSMKTVLAAFVAVVAAIPCLTSTATAFAAENQQQITAVLTAEPEYTVTIPESVTMGNEGVMVDVTASDVANLPEGKKISVSIAGTSAFRNQMVLEADTSPRTSIRYQIISEAGEVIETNASTGAQGVGKEVVSFTENGTKQYKILPVMDGNFKYGVAYTGSITFGIEIQ